VAASHGTTLGCVSTVRSRAALAAAVLFVAATAGTAGGAAGSAAPAGADRQSEPADPQWAERVEEAQKYAAGRQGHVGFAVVDEYARLHGHNAAGHFESASVVKVMLMVAYLRDARNRGLDDRDRHLLAPMIKRSANAPASEIYLQVGARALHKLARDAGMKGFSTGPTWGASRIAPGSQARFLYEVERYIPDRHVDYALRLMADIVPRQRWGIPPEIPQGWHIRFKGGWAPEAAGWKINQVAMITNGDRRLAVAVLTRGNPSKGYGEATVRGVAERLLRGYE
jgi:beta-lactamase class A